MLTEFGRCNRKIRIDHGAILADMAKALNVTSSYLSAVEHGKRKMPEGWVQLIVKEYKLTDEESKELREAAERSRKEIAIPLGVSKVRDNLALSFARVFEDCDQVTLLILQNYLQTIRKEKKN